MNDTTKDQGATWAADCAAAPVLDHVVQAMHAMSRAVGRHYLGMERVSPEAITAMLAAREACETAFEALLTR